MSYTENREAAEDYVSAVTEDARKFLKENVKHSIGYAESDNKAEFLKGVDVTINRALAYLMPKLKEQHRAWKDAEMIAGDRREQLRTIAKIILEYSPE